MKKNQTMLSLAVFMLIATGCAVDQLAVVKSVGHEKYLLEDINTKTEKLFLLNNPSPEVRDYSEFVYPGDTVLIRSRHYDATFPQVLEAKKRDAVYLDSDSLCARMERKKFEILKQQMQNEKSR